AARGWPREARNMRKLVVATTVVLLAGAAGASDYHEDFDLPGKDPRFWGADDVDGHGELTARNGRLEYTVSNPTAEDGVDRLFARGRGTYAAAWSVVIRLFNSTSPNKTDQNCSFGIHVASTRDDHDSMYAEMYASQLGGPPMRKGFDAEFFGDHVSQALVDT